MARVDAASQQPEKLGKMENNVERGLYRKMGARQAHRHRLQRHGKPGRGDGDGQHDGCGARQPIKRFRP